MAGDNLGVTLKGVVEDCFTQLQCIVCVWGGQCLTAYKTNTHLRVYQNKVARFVMFTEQKQENTGIFDPMKFSELFLSIRPRDGC